MLTEIHKHLLSLPQQKTTCLWTDIWYMCHKTTHSNLPTSAKMWNISNSNLLHCSMDWSHSSLVVCLRHSPVYLHALRVDCHHLTQQILASGRRCTHAGIAGCSTVHQVLTMAPRSFHFQRNSHHFHRHGMSRAAYPEPSSGDYPPAVESKFGSDHHLSMTTRIPSTHQLHVRGNYSHRPCFQPHDSPMARVAICHHWYSHQYCITTESQSSLLKEATTNSLTNNNINSSRRWPSNSINDHSNSNSSSTTNNNNHA